MIDLTKDGPPVTDVRVKCPECDMPIVVHEVTFGVPVSERMNCEGCDSRLSIEVAAEATWSVLCQESGGDDA